jgi:nucleotide-binding universal stress UspA family protein
MFKRILVPLDLTDKHRSALDNALELARQSGGEVTLLHVIEVIPGLSRDDESAFYNRLERMARQHLEQHSKVFAERNIPVHREVVYSNRAPEIARYAAESGADLIVLTAPQIEPANPASWGSMSYKVSILARCPVLLVR